MGAKDGSYYRRWCEDHGEFEPTPARRRQMHHARSFLSVGLPKTGFTWVITRIEDGILCTNPGHPPIMWADDADSPICLNAPSDDAFAPAGMLSDDVDWPNEVEEQ